MKKLKRIVFPNVGAGLLVIGVRAKSGCRVIVQTYSRSYALAVIRKWRRRGYTEFFFEAIQQEED